METFLGGLFVGFIAGMALAAIFMRDKLVEVKELDDETTNQLMKVLDLAEGDQDAV